MSKIVIYSNNKEMFIRHDENDYLFSYRVLNNVINENGLPCKINVININNYTLNKICSVLRDNNLDVRSFNAFTNKDEKNKFIIKVREKEMRKEK